MNPLRIVAACLLVGIAGTLIAQAPKDKPAQPRLKFNAKQIAEAEAKLIQASCSLHHEDLPPAVPNGPPLKGETDIVAFPVGTTDADLGRLIPWAVRLPKLETIDLGKSKGITSKGFKELAKIPDLKALFLDGCTVDEDALKEIANLKQLQWLDISRSTVSDANLKLLADFPSLQHLTLEQVPGLTENGVAHLQKMPRLRSLRITIDHDPSAMMEQIGKMDMLVELKATPVGDDEAKEIGNLTRLQVLDLNNGMNYWRAFRGKAGQNKEPPMDIPAVRPPAIPKDPEARKKLLAKLAKQEGFTGISAKGFPHILKCTELRVLKLAGHAVDVKGSGLDKLEFLQELDLSGTEFSDDGVSWLGRLKLLRKLWLSGTSITNEGVKGLSVAGGLELVALDFLPLTDESVSYLARNRKLKELSLNSTRVACADRRAWSGFGRLERVYLEETNITDSTLMNLAPLKTLRIVDARNNCPNISLAGARALQNELPTGSSVWAHSCEFAYWPGGGGVPIREPNRGYYNSNNNTRDPGAGPTARPMGPPRAPPPPVRLAPLPGTGK